MVLPSGDLLEVNEDQPDLLPKIRSNHGTFGVRRAQAQKALGERLRSFEETRRTYDPGLRLLNDYFQDLLTFDAAPSSSR